MKSCIRGLFLSSCLVLLVSCSSEDVNPSIQRSLPGSHSVDSAEVNEPNFTHDCQSDLISYPRDSPFDSEKVSRDWCHAFGVIVTGLQRTGYPIDYESEKAFDSKTYSYARKNLTDRYYVEIHRNLQAVQDNKKCLPNPSENSPYCNTLSKSEFINARSAVSGIYPLFAMDTQIKSLNPASYSLRDIQEVRVRLISDSEKSSRIQYSMKIDYWPLDTEQNRPSSGPVSYQASGEIITARAPDDSIKLDSGTYANAFLSNDPDRPIK